MLRNEGWNGLLTQAPVHIDPAWIFVLEVVVTGLPRRIAEVIEADDLHLGVGFQEHDSRLTAVEAHLQFDTQLSLW